MSKPPRAKPSGQRKGPDGTVAVELRHSDMKEPLTPHLRRVKQGQLIRAELERFQQLLTKDNLQTMANEAIGSLSFEKVAEATPEAEMNKALWVDVDLQRRRLTIKESKSGEARHIPLNNVAIAGLQRQPRMIDNPYVFYGRNSGQPMHNGIKNSE